MTYSKFYEKVFDYLLVGKNSSAEYLSAEEKSLIAETATEVAAALCTGKDASDIVEDSFFFGRKKNPFAKEEVKKTLWKMCRNIFRRKR